MIQAAVQDIAQEQEDIPPTPAPASAPAPTIYEQVPPPFSYLPPPVPPHMPFVPPPAPYDHNMNAAFMSENQQLRQELNAIKRDLMSMRTSQQFPYAPTGTTGNQPPSHTTRQKKPWAYCHTHGYCKHAGSECVQNVQIKDRTTKMKRLYTITWEETRRVLNGGRERWSVPDGVGLIKEEEKISK